MRKLILAAVPFALLLAGCGETHYSDRSDYSSGYSTSYSSESRPTYRSYDSEPYNASARSGPPNSGGYPVNPNVICKTG